MDQMIVYGAALEAFARGDHDAVLTLERDDGFVSDVPVRVFFQGPGDWFPIETLALGRCRGRVLDVGAGAGRHSLWLQEHGHLVTAIDVSAAAVAIMRESGLRDARLLDVWDLNEGSFDTVIILGRSIGIAADLEGLDRLLVRLRGLLAAQGRILLTSLDVSKSQDSAHATYREANVHDGRYAGEIRFRERFGDLLGPVVRWLYIDPIALERAGRRCGLSVQVLRMEPDGNYLAELERVGDAEQADRADNTPPAR